MARYCNGVSDFLRTESTIDLSAYNKLSVSLWLKWTAYANTDTYALDFTASGWDTAGGFGIDPNFGTGNFAVLAQSHFASITRPSANVWHCYTATFDKSLATNRCHVYYDGGLPANTIGNGTGTTMFVNDYLNIMCKNNGSNSFGQGSIARISIHNGILTWAQHTRIYHGENPAAIGNCLYYWPIAGLASPEPAYIGSVNLNVTGTATTGDPPVEPYAGRTMQMLPDLLIPVSGTNIQALNETLTYPFLGSNIQATGDSASTMRQQPIFIAVPGKPNT